MLSPPLFSCLPSPYPLVWQKDAHDIVTKLLDGGHSVPTAIRDEAVRQENELIYHEVVADIEHALTTGGAKGSVLNLDVSSINTEHLEAMVAGASRAPGSTPALTNLLETAKLVIAVRKAQKAENYNLLRSVLQRASEREGSFDPIAHDELETALTDVANREALEALEGALKGFHTQNPMQRRRYSVANMGQVDIDMETIDVKELDQAIALAEGLQTAMDEHVGVLLDTVRTIRQLRAAMRAGDWGQVQKVIDTISSPNATIKIDKLAQAELEMTKFQLMIRGGMVKVQSAIREGRVVCDNGLLYTSNTRISHLETALSRLKPALQSTDLNDANTVYRKLTSHAKRQLESLLRTGDRLLEIRSALLKGEYVQGLKLAHDAVHFGEPLTYARDELENYVYGLRTRLRYDYIVRFLEVAEAGCEEHALEFGVRTGFREGVQSSLDLYHVRCLESAASMLRRIRSTRSLLIELGKGSDTVNLDRLGHALSEGKTLRLETKFMVSDVSRAFADWSRTRQ